MPDLLQEKPPGSPFGSPERPAHEQESGLEADERAYEQSPESKEHFLEDRMEDAPTSPVRSAATPVQRQAATVPVRRVDEVTAHVEQILETGLGELYGTLPESARPVFKKKGEEASDQISDMVRNFKVEAGRVLRLVRDWLLTIPKVNKHFLEQESKLKTDSILEYAEQRRDEASKRP